MLDFESSSFHMECNVRTTDIYNFTIYFSETFLHTKRVHRQLWYRRLKIMEMPGIEPGAFHMRSKRSTTELHPLWFIYFLS